MSTAVQSLFEGTCDVPSGSESFASFIHNQARTRERSAEICISSSPLPQQNYLGLASAPLAEGEDLVDDPLRLAHELLGAELQLFVALQDGGLHLPEVLDGGHVKCVEGGEPSDEVLELI